jgi:AcrR family transcriptional regulator
MADPLADPAAAPLANRPPARRTARERVREEMTAEILAVARQHVARDGAPGLSLRSIARDLGMAPSALYRYFDGRDALLTALILAAYASLASEAERAAEAAARNGSDAERFLAVPRAMRRWAIAHPYEWALIFGTPVPGYEAPEDTVEPYARVAAALLRPLGEAQAAGRLRARDDGRDGRPVSAALRDAVAPVADELLPNVPVGTVVRAVGVWTAVVGAISLEVFGHWRNTVWEPGLLFEAAIRQIADAIGLQ